MSWSTCWNLSATLRTALALLTWASITAVALPASADANYIECGKDLFTGDVIDACQSYEITSRIIEEMPPEYVKRGDNYYECTFQFWTYDGASYPPSELPENLDPPEEGTRTAVAWYVCTCDQEASKNCPASGGQGIPMVAVDSSSGTLIYDPFIESAVPSTAMGTCSYKTPCALSLGVAAATAKASVAGKGFDSWLNGSTQRTVEEPAGLQVAFYSDESGGCVEETWTGTSYCYEPPQPFNPVLVDWTQELIPVPIKWDLNDICRYVIGTGIEGCPGCGPDGYCPGLALRLEALTLGLEGELSPYSVDDLYDMYVLDRLTGEIVSTVERVDELEVVVSFQPDRGEYIDGDRYVLLANPNPEAVEALSSGPLYVSVRMDYTCGG